MVGNCVPDDEHLCFLGHRWIETTHKQIFVILMLNLETSNRGQLTDRVNPPGID